MIVMQLDFEKMLLTGGVGAISLMFWLFKLHPPALHRPGSNFVKVMSKWGFLTITLNTKPMDVVWLLIWIEHPKGFVLTYCLSKKVDYCLSYGIPYFDDFGGRFYGSYVEPGTFLFARIFRVRDILKRTWFALSIT